MEYLTHKRLKSVRRAHRVRQRIVGSSTRPRLSVHISNLHIVAQVVDDIKGVTIAYASTVGRKMEGTLSEKAAVVGQEIAHKAKQAKVDRVVFDRGPYKYHGRIKALAEAARSEGLVF